MSIEREQPRIASDSHEKLGTSVVIPVYNGARYLAETLSSLQTENNATDFETIITDNGSTDKSVKIAEQFLDSMNLKITDASSMGGKNYALNIGVGQTVGEKILFIDQDDTIEPGYVNAMSAALDKYSFVAASMDSIKLNTKLPVPPRLAPADQKLGQFSLRIAAGGTLGIRKQVFNEVGGFNEDFNFSTGDVEFCCRVQAAGHRLELVDDAVLCYRFRETIKDNFTQGITYGQGNYEIEQLYPGIRGPIEKPLRVFLGAVGVASKMLIPGRTDKAMLAHQIGKRLGYLKQQYKV